MPNVLILALSDPMGKARESCDEYLQVFFSTTSALLNLCDEIQVEFCS